MRVRSGFMEDDEFEGRASLVKARKDSYKVSEEMKTLGTHQSAAELHQH